jgi:hypothetical protein
MGKKIERRDLLKSKSPVLQPWGWKSLSISIFLQFRKKIDQWRKKKPSGSKTVEGTIDCGLCAWNL